ncbi:ketopantoate reductase family protein [Halorientalis regularis]|uniref:2-dehydropantoate 2-reductase n=1 Tax=Halorientalis regularis TaxID=660518 RepID=A0A1G7JP57_9EURY|nr:2-dehydropantoate 2-reductase [Halorientalis regularis]SDF26635.1 ketopantoate reductase [Halorientalis regularis]
MDVLVFGAGSLGSLVGGLLARQHRVTLVGRDPHVGTVAAEGLTVDGAVECHVDPDGVTEVPPDASPDLALVTVKAYDTDAAAAALADCHPSTVLSLQNGLDNEARLADRLDCPVLAGTCTYGAMLEEPGRVTCTGVGEVVLGPREGGQSPAADRVGAAFDEVGIETTVAADMPHRSWEKLAVNAGINATTALARIENGAVLDEPASEVAAAAARETARAARDAGVDLSDEAAVDAVHEVAAATADNTSSMYQDVLAERRTEVDAINGAVAERIDAPVNRTLAGLLRAWERARDRR